MSKNHIKITKNVDVYCFENSTKKDFEDYLNNLCRRIESDFRYMDGEKIKISITIENQSDREVIENFVKEQTPLEGEFAKVWDDNVEKLYEE